MRSPSYYRDQAERAQRLARSVTDRDGVKAILSQVAQEYEELAEDLEGGGRRDPASRADAGKPSSLVGAPVGENQTEESASIRGFLRLCGLFAGFHLSDSLH
jgi:hypothetical protein